jgi:glycine cleavage system H lipoate-binding protein/ABC-type phosphate transport system substrate-binding protein
MKNKLLSIAGLSLLLLGTAAFSWGGTDNHGTLPENQAEKSAVQVNCSPELYPLATIWVNSYNLANPSDRAVLNQSTDSRGQAGENLGFVSDWSEMDQADQSKWKMVVGRDVIVPVVSSLNPMFSLINQQGISSQKFAQMLSNPEGRNWASVIANGLTAPVNIYIFDSKEVISGLTGYTRIKIDAASGNLVLTAREVLNAVQKDPLAIGFCKLSDLRNNELKSELSNIRLLPVDKNGNGRMDNFEKIYDNLDSFTHGVWIGKYPNTLSKSIYAVSAVKPASQNELAFLTWILSDGQSLLNANGYCDIAGIEKQAGMASLAVPSTDGLSSLKSAPYPKSWPVFLVVIALTGLFVGIYIRSRKNAKPFLSGEEIHIAPFMVENAMNVPKGLYFDKSHTWAFLEKDGNVKVGIDDFLQHVTGKLTKIRMKEEGEVVRKGEKIMTIMHDGKQLSLYAPISGTIISQNRSLLSDSTLINSSPFSEGWVYRIEPRNWMREVQFMLMGEKYTDWLRDEFVRLKEFVAASARTDSMVYSHVVLQDGGELAENVLADLGPEVWEDFQTSFIDKSR